MGDGVHFDAALIQRMPLPLAQIYRYTLEAKTQLDRHSYALYLWEATLKLAASTAIVEYVAGDFDRAMTTELLRSLLRPALGHWLMYLRQLVPLLAQRDDAHYMAIRDLLQARSTDMPQCAKLLAGFEKLRAERQERIAPLGHRPTVRLGEVLDGFVMYRNLEVGHGPDPQRGAEFYGEMADLLIAAVGELLGRFDVLAGRRLVYCTPLQTSADQLPVLTWFELVGQVPQRHASVSEVLGDGTQPDSRPNRLYVVPPANVRHGLVSLEPLLKYDPETGQVFFYHRGQPTRPPEYRCYTTGRFTSRWQLDPADRGLVQLMEPPPGDGDKASSRGGLALTRQVIPTESWRPPGESDTQAGAEDKNEIDKNEIGGYEIGGYEILGELGSGGLGQVYRARQPMLERTVALKCLRAQHPQSRARFLREIRILGQVQHPNLPHIYGSGIDERAGLFYAMNWIQGTCADQLCWTLNDQERPQPVDLPQWYQALDRACGAVPRTNLSELAGRPVFGHVAELMRPIATALQALHDAGVVHCGVKPSNIMITADGAKAVLIGLGLVKEGVADGALTNPEPGLIGTVNYASPEEVMGTTRLDGRSDIYSFGVTLWEMLALRRLYDGDNVVDILTQITRVPPPPVRKINPRIPRRLDEIVQRCLQKDRERRYQTARALADELAQFSAAQAGSPVNRLLSWMGLGRKAMPPASFTPPFAAPAPREESVPRSPAPSRPSEKSTLAPTATLPDQAFSSQTIVTLYPAPIAMAYRRFCQETHPRMRLDALFAVLEATVRYLVTLGISDVYHCLTVTGRDPAEVFKHQDFDFLRRPLPMLQGKWVAALRETARVLGSKECEARTIKELPVVCSPTGPVVSELLAGLVKQRNEATHTDGSIRIPEGKCRDAVQSFRPQLEQLLREVGFVAQYPLGFFSPFQGVTSGKQNYYQLHSCMGSWVCATSRATDIKTSETFQVDTPFVVTPDGRRLLYLWPLLLERRSEYTSRRTLWVFQEIADDRRPFLATIRSAAIDVPEDHSLELHPGPASSHKWLIDRLRELPAEQAVPSEVRLAEKLFPTRGGKLVGLEVGSNRLLSVVAMGGFGTIYAAEAADGQRVAVKVIESRPSAAQMARFSQEIEKLRLAADFPGIIRCFEHGDIDVDGRVCPWYSMEFAHGGDLRSRMDVRKGTLKKKIPWDDDKARAESCAEFIDVAAAVAHLHGLGIVHRDVKPGNVLIVDDGGLRLSDLGLVKKLQPSEETQLHAPHTSTGGGPGTPRYMAPEQARGKHVDKSADVYSLGMVLAELALGELPNPEIPLGLSERDLPEQNYSTLKNCRSLDRLDKMLKQFIERCTQIDPAKRPCDARQALDEFIQLGLAPPREPAVTVGAEQSG